MKLRNIFFWLLFALITFSFFYFRFNNLANRIIFDWDQETLSFQLKKIIAEHKPILIGHRATDAMGFYFGPYFEYFLVPFYFISNLHPRALISFIVFINTAFYFTTFYISSKLFNKYLALSILMFWAVNPLLIAMDITVWAPILIGIGIMFTFYLLWRVYRKPSYINYLTLGMNLGLFTQIHSIFFLVDFFVAFFLSAQLIIEKKYRSPILRKIAILLGSVIFFTTPLVLFDFRHGFLNLRLFFGYFLSRTEGRIRIADSLQVFSNFFKPLIVSESILIGLVFYILIVLLLVYLIKTSKGFGKLFYISSLCVWLLSALIYFRYTQRPSEYYFIYLYPIVIIALSDFLLRLNKYALIILCFFFFIANFNSLKNITKSNDRGLFAKEATVLLLKKNINSKQFNLIYDMPRGLDTGYEYFLDYYKIKPSGNAKDPLVVFNLPRKKGDISVNTVGIQIPSSLKR